MNVVFDIVSWVLILTGSLFALTGAIGLLRLPDFFTRMHGAAIIDSFGVSMMLMGFFLQSGFTTAGVKLVLIFMFMIVTGPTATHALAKAALHGRLEPLTPLQKGSQS